MQSVNIKNNYILLDDIQRCVEAFGYILSGKGEEKRLEITATTKIEGVDPLLITYFTLFKQQIPELQIILNLPMNPIDSENEKLEYQLKQFGTFAYLATGIDAFQIIFGNDQNTPQINFDLGNFTYYPETWFVFSADYFPMLFVTEDVQLFDFIFSESLSSLSAKDYFNIGKLDKGIKWNKNSEQLKKSYHLFLRKTSSPQDRRKSLLNLAIMAFVSSLNEAKIAHLFFKDEYKKSDYDSKNKIQAGNLQNDRAFEYFSEIEPVFEDLKNNSLCHQFFFCTVLAEMLKDTTTGSDALMADTKAAFVAKITNLWGFTKDLVAGIKELAKNIREHSKPTNGAISVRLFKVEKWIENKNYTQGDDNIYDKYKKHILKQGFDKNGSVIDINVVDIGKLGVVPTLIKNTEKVLSGITGKRLGIEELIKEDIENLKSKTIGFHNLLDTSSRQLNQQSKRSIAHFGLLTLAKLVEHNNGLIVASSQNSLISSDRESICIPDLASDYSHPIRIGTNFNIVLPINTHLSYATHLPHTISLPSEISAKDIKGVEELFQYELANIDELGNGSQLNERLKYLIEINFEITQLNNRDDEDSFWSEITTKINKINLNAKTKYAFCLNLLNVSINESQLFRLLGKCELNFPSVPTIILNIENECYQKLIKINGEFYSQNEDFAYWNENISTLVYSYKKIHEGKFFFSDVLWGKTREDFAYLNHLVSLTVFNSTSLLHGDKSKVKELISKPRIVNPNTEIFFLNNSSLLPFELLLKSSEKTTLFEANTSVLLENELKP